MIRVPHIQCLVKEKLLRQLQNKRQGENRRAARDKEPPVAKNQISCGPTLLTRRCGVGEVAAYLRKHCAAPLLFGLLQLFFFCACLHLVLFRFQPVTADSSPYAFTYMFFYSCYNFRWFVFRSTFRVLGSRKMSACTIAMRNFRSAYVWLSCLYTSSLASLRI